MHGPQFLKQVYQHKHVLVQMKPWIFSQPDCKNNNLINVYLHPNKATTQS